MGKGLLALALTSIVLLRASPSAADDKSDCADAAVQGQRLRNAHKLLLAREKLLVCAAQSCPLVVQRDCTSWLAELEQSLPTAVVTATDAQGHDRLDVTLRIDDGPPADLRGQALPLDPGPHTLRLRGSDGTTAEEQVLVKEGVKNQPFPVVLATRASAAPAPAPARPTDEAGATSPWRTVGWIAGGAGIAGLALGAVFGTVAIVEKGNAHCDATNACDPGPLSTANTTATVSTVGFVTGGVLLAGGGALLLFAPRRTATVGDGTVPRDSPVREAGALSSLKIVPSFGPQGGNVLLQGAF